MPNYAIVHEVTLNEDDGSGGTSHSKVNEFKPVKDLAEAEEWIRRNNAKDSYLRSQFKLVEYKELKVSTKIDIDIS